MGSVWIVVNLIATVGQASILPTRHIEFVVALRSDVRLLMFRVRLVIFSLGKWVLTGTGRLLFEGGTLGREGTENTAERANF